MRPYLLNKEESDRLSILKYIAIIFVVYIHSYSTGANFADGAQDFVLPWWLPLLEYFISQVVARFAVPIFFLISSVLLFKSEREYKKTLFGKAKTLLVPYIFWNTFWILVFVVLQNLSFTAPFFSGSHTPILQSSFYEWLELYGIGYPLPYPQDYPLWFMRDLIIVILFYPVIGKIAKVFPKALLLISVVLLIAPVNFTLKQALLWFCIGACIVNLQIHITDIDKAPVWLCSIIYFVAAIVTLLLKQDVLDNLFVFVGIIYWARLSKSIFDSEKSRKLFLALSKWTFIIYAAHELTLTSLQKVCMRLLPTQPILLLMEFLFLPIVVIAGCSIAGAIIKKITPKFYAVITGAR